MKTSTEIGAISVIIGEERAVEYVAKAGFDAWDFSMFQACPFDWERGEVIKTGHPILKPDYLKFARKLKQIGLDNGISCNQGHAGFPVDCKEIRSYLKRNIECLAEAGGEILVIHPESFSSPEKNAEMYFELLPFAKDCGVKIATENMWGWDTEKNRASFAACATAESFKAHIDAVNDEYFVACVDIGHAEMMGEDANAPELIKSLGNKVQALHIHDNNKWKDSHQIPFSMDIDFGAVINALKEINYNGYFTLECNGYLGDCTEENAFDKIKKLSDSAKRLAEMFGK